MPSSSSPADGAADQKPQEEADRGSSCYSSIAVTEWFTQFCAWTLMFCSRGASMGRQPRSSPFVVSCIAVATAAASRPGSNRCRVPRNFHFYSAES